MGLSDKPIEVGRIPMAIILQLEFRCLLCHIKVGAGLGEIIA
jgi:hypothetical protein